MKVRNAIGLLVVILLIVGWGVLALNGVSLGAYTVKSYADSMALGLDLRGGVYVVYEASIPEGEETEADFSSLMDGTISKLQTRLSDSGFTEATVSKQGNNRIRVEIPDVQDPQELLDLLGSPAHLTFTDPDGNVVIEGKHINNVSAGYIDGDKPVIQFRLNSEGTSLFAEATNRLQGQTIYINLDDRVLSAPTVRSAITGGEGVIEGMESIDEANQIAKLIQSGALPMDLAQLELRTISATLGEDAMTRSVLAAGIGIALVMLFMIAVYRLPGIMAALALAIYVLLDLLLLIAFRIQLTLPGIAGVILSIGMAVDANVIIFERVKDELRTGKSVRASVESGFRRAFSAILDSNVTTLIAAVVLGIFGTGPIKGFAYTLGIGVVVSMFTAVVITRFLLRRMVNLQIVSRWLYGTSVVEVSADGEPVKPQRSGFSVMRFFRPSVIILCLVLVAGLIGGVFMGGLNIGIDFTGGTMITIAIPGQFDESVVENAFKDAGIDNVSVATTYDGVDTSAVVRIQDINDPDREAEILSGVEAKLLERYPDTKIESNEHVGAVAGADLIRNAILAIVIACALMLVYIWIRFELKSGVSAIVAIATSVLLMIAGVALTRTQINTAFIAAVLTIIGYSINNTIVIFDRIRENNKKYSVREMTRSEVANISVRESLTRTINTTITTLITLVLVYVLGVESIKEFALPLLIGMIAGVLTSIFIAPPVWGLWMDRQNNPQRREKRA